MANLVERPVPFDSVVGNWKKPPGPRYPNGPSRAHHLGQVEWAWAFGSGRVCAYYLHKARRHWILWERWYDDNWEKWEWTPVGYVPNSQASKEQAAIHLLIDYWHFYEAGSNVGHYDWINETGDLSTSEWRTIGRLVWPVAVSQPSGEAGDASDC